MLEPFKFWKRFGNKPQEFFLKEITQDGIKYTFQEENILNYIMNKAVHSEFLVFTLVGESQEGKSQLIQNLTGIKHNIGDSLSPETNGATIAYAGTVRDIYERMGLTPPNCEFLDRDVFFCDTEGVYDELEKGSIASLIMPLLIFSSKVITIVESKPSSSFTNFLSICKSFINVSNEESDDPFTDKLIVRFKDYPQKKSNYQESDIETLTQKIENSQIAKNFKEHFIHPIYVPGGPWDADNECHLAIFTKNFLDKIFANQENVNVFSNPQKFVNNVVELSQSSNNDYSKIMSLFRNRNMAERILDYVLIQIEDEVNILFNDCMEKMEYRENEFDSLYNDDIEKLTSIIQKHRIKEKYLNKYLKKVRKYFDYNKRKLIFRIQKYNHYKLKLNQAKNSKEKCIESIQYLSEFVADNANIASENIFYNVQTHFCKIEAYQQNIINNINAKKKMCVDKLNKAKIPIPEIVSFIVNDINAIFNKLLEFKTFTQYRQYGVLSKILSYFFDDHDYKGQGDLIVSPNVWAFVNEKTNKYMMIIAESRRYLDGFKDLVETTMDQKAIESLNSDQKKAIHDYCQENSIKSISDLTDEQIEMITKNQIKLLFNEEQLTE